MTMNAPLTKIDLMLMDEFIRRSEHEGPFEFVDGEIVPKMPTTALHNKIGKRVFIALLPYEQQRLGEAFQEATFALTDNPQWVRGSRIPDVMFVLQPKLEAFQRDIPDWEVKPYILIPDLAVEIVSPTDNYNEVVEKVERYLRDGVRVVWLINPQLRQVVVYRASSAFQETLTDDATLREDELLPSFELSLAELFAV